MVEGALRFAAILSTAVMLVSFGLFAIDQSGTASQKAQGLVNASGAQALGPPLTVGTHHNAVRVVIDDSSDALGSPFQSFAPGTRDSWLQHAFVALLGLLVYGFGLGALARSVAFARFKPPAPPPRSWSGF